MSLTYPVAAEAVSVLDRLEDPVLLIDQQRRIIHSNAAARRVLLAKAGFEARQSRLVVTTAAGGGRLVQTITECMRLRHLKASGCRGMKLPRKSAAGDWLILISPFRPLSLDPSNSCVFVVHLVSRVHTRHLPLAALRDLFGLTHKEIDVLVGLLKRESLRAVALRMSLSHETIRTYVKRILRKCDVRSQTGLISLLQRLSLLAGPD